MSESHFIFLERIQDFPGGANPRGDCQHILPPATKLRQGNVFTPVCHSVHRGGVCLWSRGVSTTPPGQTPPADPPGRHPLGRHPLADTPSLGRHPWADTPRAVRAGIRRSTSGRYASYWNAFLFGLFSPKTA